MKKRLLILAGGMASRMKKALAEENSDLDPKLVAQANAVTKGMIQVGKNGKTLIDYQLYNAHLAGIEEVMLLLHPTDSVSQEYCESLMAKDATWGMKIVFARQQIAADREKPAGTADAVYQALSQHTDWQTGRVIVCNSDNLYSVNALKTLWASEVPQALISYHRDSLLYPEERISAFALIRTDAEGYLLEIIEKPTKEQAEELMAKQGRLGVSMNVFVFEASTFLPYLAKTPFHAVRNEKELPTSVVMFGEGEGKGFFAIPLAENVPDLTSKEDILVMQKYLEETYGDF
ncbi:sugar phosphate nucleotidyltransferase [Aquirufa lenticrescens]|uniref:sugar phosphate nucleotidyltransferase n=1 Tax=Aquirufa lenticrescens TaxID=2696560 RepID=UPI001CAA75BE|nr:sugar phosphate nucleotidyltransferase [Aquirufa lenticrescens]UAJ14535.1 NTP transferase domain-containing protein [Aquirufa lenticrescens]